MRHLLLAIVIGLLTVRLSSSVSSAAEPPRASIAPQLDNNSNPPMPARNANGTLDGIERLDPALDELIAPDAKIEILVENVQWAEGPVWSGGALYFSDVPQNTVYRWTPDGGVAPFLKPSGYTGTIRRGGEPGSNGLTVDRDGRLVLCQHGDRRVIRLEKDLKTFTVLAERYKGKRFNSPNDLCFDAKGNLYFSDPPYGLEGNDADPKKEMDVNGIYLVRPTGEIVRTNTGEIVYADGRRAPLKFPNGVALSPDGRTLYVCVSDDQNPVYLKYEVQPDGDVRNGRVFFDAKELAAKGRKGGPDGVKVDTAGNVWATGPGGVLVFTPQGKHLGTILTGVPTANLNWGDDGSTLYICANHNVCRIRTKAKGAMPGPLRE